MPAGHQQQNGLSANAVYHAPSVPQSHPEQNGVGHPKRHSDTATAQLSPTSSATSSTRHMSSSVTFGDTKPSAEQAAAQATPLLESQSHRGDRDAGAHDVTLQEGPPSFSQEDTWRSHACRLHKTFTRPTDSASDKELVGQKKGDPLLDGQSRPATSDCLLGRQARLEGLAQQRVQDMRPKFQCLRGIPPEPPALKFDGFEDASHAWALKLIDGIEAAAVLPASSEQYSSSFVKELAQQVDTFKRYTGDIAHWLAEDVTAANEMLKDCGGKANLQVHLQVVYEKTSIWFAVSQALFKSITAFFQRIGCLLEELHKLYPDAPGSGSPIDVLALQRAPEWDFDLNLYERMNKTYQKLLRKGDFPSAGGPYATGHAAFAIADQDVSAQYIFDSPSLDLYHASFEKPGTSCAIRLRWYGQGKPKRIFVEKPDHLMDDRGFRQRVEGFRLHEGLARKLVAGKCGLREAEDNWARHKPLLMALPRMRSLFRTVCNMITQKKLRPVIQTQYTRTIYHRSDFALVATLDTHQLLFKPAAASNQWFRNPHSWSTKIVQMCPRLEMAVMLADTFSLPDWFGASVTQTFLTEVPSHGYYLPAVIKLFSEQVKIVPPENWESRARRWTKCRCVGAALAESFLLAAWDGNPAACSQVILRSSQHMKQHPPLDGRVVVPVDWETLLLFLEDQLHLHDFQKASEAKQTSTMRTAASPPAPGSSVFDVDKSVLQRVIGWGTHHVTPAGEVASHPDTTIPWQLLGWGSMFLIVWLGQQLLNAQDQTVLWEAHILDGKM
ncbi:hypothetical protein WJX74_002014 [Apatococcus lobatus]|uniref:VTC domain-containing protein n=1 Tax=Apatococcus lobatus TaxID=904363 RepID=A0AAW1RL44_9CHLO